MMSENRGRPEASAVDGAKSADPTTVSAHGTGAAALPLAGNVAVKENRTYSWECPNDGCRWSTTSDSRAETNKRAERHLRMDVLGIKGTRVRVVGLDAGMHHYPARNGDTGTISYAYVDQDRYGVKLDRKGRCDGCRHCDGCGQATPLSAELPFDKLEAI